MLSMAENTQILALEPSTHTHTHILLKHMTISESHNHSLFTPYDRTMWYSVGINVLVEEDWINWLQMWASERLEPVRLKLFARVPLLTSDVPTENSSHFHCWLFTVKSNPLPSPPRHTHTHTHTSIRSLDCLNCFTHFRWVTGLKGCDTKQGAKVLTILKRLLLLFLIHIIYII